MNISDVEYNEENGRIGFTVERADVFDYDAIDHVTFVAALEGSDLSCEFDLTLQYSDSPVISQYEVIQVGGYPFLPEGDYYKSSNYNLHSTFCLCRIVFTTNTGRLLLHCIGGGESNYDYGIVSNLDCPLSASANSDSGSNVKKSFYGYGSYDQVLEFDVPDTDEHSIFVKYRKDGSVTSGMDCIKFRVRFDDE